MGVPRAPAGPVIAPPWWDGRRGDGALPGHGEDVVSSVLAVRV